MSIKDEQRMPYFRCFAFMNNHERSQLEDFIKENPFEAKKQLASFFVSLQAKDIAQGERARAEFERKFSKKTINAEAVSYTHLDVYKRQAIHTYNSII